LLLCDKFFSATFYFISLGLYSKNPNFEKWHSNSTDNMVDVLQQIVELAVAHDIQI